MTTREGRFTRSAARDIRLRDPAIRRRWLHLGQVGDDSGELAERKDAGHPHKEGRSVQGQGKGAGQRVWRSLTRSPSVSESIL